MEDLENTLTRKIQDYFGEDLHYLELINETPPGVSCGAKFEIIVVSDKFGKVPLLKRHKMVHEILKEELEDKELIHAVTIKAKTVKQYSRLQRIFDNFSKSSSVGSKLRKQLKKYSFHRSQGCSPFHKSQKQFFLKECH
eukprot:maker-scaffold_8-snap-gene-8.67-mRNA-1 protein AED:0.58 eAED:0.58 QI:0/0/0/0.33/1/1/3/0/138